MSIEIDGIDCGENVFLVFETMAKKRLNAIERAQETQRQDIAIDRDAAQIAGKLTDEFYKMVYGGA